VLLQIFFADQRFSKKGIHPENFEQYLQKIENTNASYLSQLTDGIHLHTIEADSTEKLNAACDALDRAGFLVY